MIEIIDFLTQTEKIRNRVKYVNGSRFVGKRQLSIISGGRMIEIIDFFS